MLKSELDFNEIIILDILGREIFRENMQAQFEKQIDLNAFSEGIYSLKALVKNEWQTETIIIK